MIKLIFRYLLTVDEFKIEGIIYIGKTDDGNFIFSPNNPIKEHSDLNKEFYNEKWINKPFLSKMKIQENGKVVLKECVECLVEEPIEKSKVEAFKEKMISVLDTKFIGETNKEFNLIENAIDQMTYEFEEEIQKQKDAFNKKINALKDDFFKDMEIKIKTKKTAINNLKHLNLKELY